MKKSITVLFLTLILLLACSSVSIADKEPGGMLIADGIPAAEPAVAEDILPSEAPEAADVVSDVISEDEPEVSEEAVAEAEGVFSFASVRPQMMEHNTDLLILESSIDVLENMDYEGLMDDLRDAINTVADLQWAAGSSIPVQIKGTEMIPDEIAAANNIPKTYNVPVADSYATTQLKTQYDSLHEQFEAMKDGETKKDNELTIRQLKTFEESLVQAGETLFVTVKGLDVQYGALLRQDESLARTLKELQVRKKYGQISELVLAQTESGKAQLESGISTLKMNIDNLLLQYRLLLGMDLGSELTLGKVPVVSEKNLNEMDLEKDLAAAAEASYELSAALETYQDAEETWKDTEDDLRYASTATDKMMLQKAQIEWQKAQYAYQGTKDNFELKFRTLYADVKNKADLLKAAKAAYTAEEKNYAASQVKYRYGQISANALADASDALQSAKDSVDTASFDLFTAYNNYTYAVNSGILN